MTREMTPPDVGFTTPEHLRKEAMLVAAKGALYGVLVLLELANEPELRARAEALHVDVVKQWRRTEAF